MKAKLVLNFIGSLFPYIFPAQEFKPNRLVAVVLLAAVFMFGIDHFGIATVEAALEFTDDAIDMTEE